MTSREFIITGIARSLLDFSDDFNYELTPNLLGRRVCGLVIRNDHDLDDARAITDVEKYEFAVVTACMYPTEHAYCLTDFSRRL